MLKDKNNSLLTSRGNVSVDKRTNTLLIQDIEPKLQEIKALLKKLDVPMRQVEIATQLVAANKSLEDTLGVRFGGGSNVGFGHRRLGIGSGIERARAIADYPGGIMPPSQAAGASGSIAANDTLPKAWNTEGLFSDLSSAAQIGTVSKVGLALARLPGGTLLDLELQASEYENVTKTLTRPKIVTMDQQKASVSKGTQIPYAQSSSSGVSSIAYQNAEMKLEVTPHITPDDKIFLDLDISNDEKGASIVTSTSTSGTTSQTNAGPAINTNHIQTKVLVDNGATIILGGVLQVTEQHTVSKVPFFSNIPVIGGLFRNKFRSYAPQELVIFLTPRIINTITD
jgi:type IV pilus assembly protein PilQ